MAREECRVTERGISHLFAPFAVGAACVCGRKVAVVEDGTLTIQDGPCAALLSTMETLQRRLQWPRAGGG
jgi:hypothetical protein